MITVSHRNHRRRLSAKYDFHLHSYYSDGEWSPFEIVREARSIGMRGIAITDHNGLFPNYARVNGLAKKLGLELFQGIEISTKCRTLGRTIHVLGYSARFNRGLLKKALADTVNHYEERAMKIVARCQEEGIPIDYGKIRRRTREFFVSRYTLAASIAERMHTTTQDALRYCFVPEQDDWMMETEHAVSLIIRAKGIPVLAHPGNLLVNKQGKITREEIEKLDGLLDALKQAGLAGIEVFYPKHKARQVEILLRLAHTKDLIPTGGTDWHGYSRTPDVRLGDRGPDKSSVRRFKILLSTPRKLSRV